MASNELKIKYEFHYAQSDINGKKESNSESALVKAIYFASEGKWKSSAYRVALGADIIVDLGGQDKGAIPVIPRRKNSKTGNDDIDWCLYKYRHLVENAFGRIKNFRAIATRYDKLEQNYASMVALAFTIMWLPMHC